MTDIKKTASSKGVENAPLEIKIAVDLIQLLEESNLPIDSTIKALEIVLKDFKKQKAKES